MNDREDFFTKQQIMKLERTFATTYNEEVGIMPNKVNRNSKKVRILNRIINEEVSRFSIILVVCAIIYFILTVYL